jgi:hypothetical protein
MGYISKKKSHLLWCKRCSLHSTWKHCKWFQFIRKPVRPTRVKNGNQIPNSIAIYLIGTHKEQSTSNRIIKNRTLVICLQHLFIISEKI